VYSAVSCDICDIEALRLCLEKAGVDFTAPTLLVAECVLTYIKATSVNALLAWCAISFSNAIFCTYEQIHPQDTFGRVMKRHFENIRSPLKNVDVYPTEESQRKRYLSAGWDFCKSCDMNTFFSWLPEKEKQRIRGLEQFDEYEEWHLKCSHYMILCAFKGRVNVLKDHILPNSFVGDDSLRPVYKSVKLTVESIYYSSSCLKRYGHGSCVLSDGSIVIIGGYGESSFGGITPHSRLNDVLKLQLDTEGWKLCSLDNVHGSGPGLTKS
jgi:tRNA wybutosine-synthesizing protein 4